MKNFSTPKVADFMIDLQSTNAESYEMALQVRDAYFIFDPDVSEGASLSDPHSGLEGKGKHRRHIKINFCKDIQAKNVSAYVKETLTPRSVSV